MRTYLVPSDLAALTTADPAALEVMITDVTASAVAAAPCLDGDLPEGARAAVVALLRGAVERWAERSTREGQQMTAGPFTIGQGPYAAGGGERRSLLWPSEIQALQRICSSVNGRARGRAYMGWLA